MSYLEKIKKDNGVLEIWLNRPQLHNAFNAELIEELIEVFSSLKDERLVILGGRGTSFCAGADLNWMKAMKDFSYDENFNDAKRLAKMFSVINECPIPVIGRINGHALGGGLGLVSVCDYVISRPQVLFGFTEVKLGLIPAVISPYCISKIGESHARAWMISGEKFSAQRALQMGLIHEICEEDEMDEKILDWEMKFLTAAPMATQEAKKLIQQVVKAPKNAEDFTCQMIARKRTSLEGQEGMTALLNKEKPSWIKS